MAIARAALTPGERSLRARIGGFAAHAKYDSAALTAPARAAFLRRFEAEVDFEGLLSPKERARRAEAAKKAYFARLALKSARARRGNGTAALEGGRPEDLEVTRRAANVATPPA